MEWGWLVVGSWRLVPYIAFAGTNVPTWILWISVIVRKSRIWNSVLMA